MIPWWVLLIACPICATIGYVLCGIMVVSSNDEDERQNVVRCKDCRYCDDLGMSGLWCRHPDHRHPMSVANEYLGCRQDDYCSDGKRRRKTQ